MLHTLRFTGLLLLAVACSATDSGQGDPGPGQAPNTLSAAEENAGFVLLFDGQSPNGWRGFKQSGFPDGWAIEDGTLTCVNGGGDIITTGQYDDFILRLEWKIAPGGNSGVFFHVTEAGDAVWRTGPEMQVLDNAAHRDGSNELTSAGSNYALHAPKRDVTRPAGDWNAAQIEVREGRVTHTLNGVEIVDYVLLSEDWEELVAASKFGAMPGYGRAGRGHVALQDHGDRVWFRSVRILALD